MSDIGELVNSLLINQREIHLTGSKDKDNTEKNSFLARILKIIKEYFTNSTKKIISTAALTAMLVTPCLGRNMDILVYNKYCPPAWAETFATNYRLLGYVADTTRTIPTPNSTTLFVIPTVYPGNNSAVNFSAQDSSDLTVFVNQGGHYYWFGKKTNNLSEILNITPGDSSSNILINRISEEYLPGHAAFQYQQDVALRGIHPTNPNLGDTLVMETEQWISLGILNFYNHISDTTRQGIALIADPFYLSESSLPTALGFAPDVISIDSGAINDKLPTPKNIYLQQNYPNPFNSTTIIKYSVPEYEKNNFIDISIYNIAGQKIKGLLNNQNMNGATGENSIRWDGTNDKGQSVSSGVYIVKYSVDKIKKDKKNYGRTTETIKIAYLK